MKYPTYFIPALLTFLSVIPLTGHTQSVTVMGGEGKARECYMAATMAAQFNTASNVELETCTYALENVTLTLRDRGATFINRGIINAALEKYQDSVADYKKAEKLFPKFGEVYINRGNLFFMSGIYDEAITEYSKAMEHQIRKIHVAYFNRGLAYERLKEYVKAESDYLKAIELAPEWFQPKSKLERVRKKINNS